jgi:CelD/BcsL family acetyltransferase involved in cellulose biosynthesis/dTDP-4-amino-4,6-dideoxygalactose transaminase
VRALRLREDDEVLVPAYHHGSEIEALVSAGLVPRFYSTRPGLMPDVEELESMLGPRTRAVMLIHVLGLVQPTSQYRDWCDQHGLLLIEDAAQAWLSDIGCAPVGREADLSLFCLYKTFGLPDGAALFVRDGAPQRQRDPGSALPAVAKAHAAWVAQRSALFGAAWSWARSRRGMEFDTAREIALGDTSAAMSSIAEKLLARLVATPAAAIRRAHYRLLFERLAELVPEQMPLLTPGAAPFAFPVSAPDKAPLLDRLEGAGIHALDFWSVPHPALEPQLDPVAARLRSQVVGLPLHQELVPDDLDRITAVVLGPRRPPQGPGLTTTELPGFEAASPDWAALAEQSGNIFGTPEWLTTWWRHLGRGELSLRQCRARDGRLVAVLPMARELHGALRVLRFCSADVGDELGPICAPTDQLIAAHAWRRILEGTRGDWDIALAERLPGDASWPTLARLMPIRREASPVLAIADLDWQAFLASRSRNFRQQLRRFERRLVRDRALRFRLADDPGRLDTDFDTLVALHRARWRRDRVDAFAGRREAFHREFARIALERGWLRLWIAELNGSPAAAWYGMRFGGSEWYYQAGRNPDRTYQSVGVVVMAHTVREAIADGQRTYRLLRGDEQYKRRWSTHDYGLDTAGRASGPRGKAVLTALRAGYTIPPELRSRSRAVMRAAPYTAAWASP